MAKSVEVAAAKVPVVDYVCGLRKTGPSLYVVVRGKITDGVADLLVGDVAQGIDHASEELREAYRRLVSEGGIP